VGRFWTTKDAKDAKGMTPNEVSKVVLDSAMKVHSVLGAGLLEEAYKVCLKHDLQKRGLQVLSEVALPVVYDGVSLDVGFRIDLLVENSLIIELKSVQQLAPIHKAQILTYLKLSRVSLGLLLNFNSVHLKNGIVRVINS
jgi:GxxExxY protein